MSLSGSKSAYPSRGMIAVLLIVVGAICVAIGLAIHHNAFKPMAAAGLNPGGPLLDLYNWLIYGGGGAVVLGIVAQVFPNLHLPVVPGSQNAIDMAIANLIGQALKKHQEAHPDDKQTAEALKDAGRAAVDAARDKAFPPVAVLFLGLALTMSLMGCSDGPAVAPINGVINGNKPANPSTPEFSTGAAAAALVRQIEEANKSPAVESNELLQGILTFGGPAGLPASFCDTVRAAVPELGKGPRDLSEAEVEAIRRIQ